MTFNLYIKNIMTVLFGDGFSIWQIFARDQSPVHVWKITIVKL
jgi:hypothetical protein